MRCKIASGCIFFPITKFILSFQHILEASNDLSPYISTLQFFSKFSILIIKYKYHGFHSFSFLGFIS